MTVAAIRQSAAPAVVPHAGRARASRWPRPGAGWVVLSAGTLPGLPAAGPEISRFLLLHPGRGMVILDLWPPDAMPPGEEAPLLPPAALDAELRLASFLRRLDPRLPVHRIHLAEAALPKLAGVLSRAFAGAEPLRLPGGAAWVGAVQASLAKPPPPPALPAPAPRRRSQAGRRRLGAGLATLGVAASVTLLTLGGRFLAEGPSPPARDAAIIAEAARADPLPAVPRLPLLPPVLAEAIHPAPPPVVAHLAPPPALPASLPQPAWPGPPPLPSAVATATPDAPPSTALDAGPVPPAPLPATAGRAGRQALAMARPRPPIREAQPSRAAMQAAPSKAHAAVAADASSRCRAIVLHVQLGEELSHADRGYLRAGCMQRR